MLNAVQIKKINIEDHQVLWEFKDVFPEEVPELPPKRDIDFSIDPILGVVPTSKVPYRMSMVELVELKVQLKDMMDRGYIKPSVSPWGETTLFVKKKYGTLWLYIEYR
jgi:hypothetical protein